MLPSSRGREVSQEDNFNANARLFIQPDGTVVKLYTRFDGNTYRNIYNACVLRMFRRGFPGFAFPQRMLWERGHIVGFVMPYFPGLSLDAAIDTLSPEAVRTAFIRLAEALYSLPAWISVGDLHGKNVIAGNCGTVRLIDPDGFSLRLWFSMSSPLDFLSEYPDMYEIRKYRSLSGNVRRVRNADIICYFRLLFRWVMGTDAFLIYTAEEMNRYFSYLSELGFPEEIVLAYERLFTSGNNYIPIKVLKDMYLTHFSKWSYRAFYRSEYDTYADL